VAAAPATADVNLAGKPALYPPFQRSVTDYVSRCVPGKPLVLSGSATGGETVAVGSHPAKSGNFSENVNRKPGGGVTVRVTSPTQPGTFHVRCLPRDFPKWDTTRTGTPQAQWYVITPNGNTRKGYAAVFDTNGVPVWWRHASSYGPWDAKLLPGGVIAWTHYVGGPFGQADAYGYEEHSFDGTQVGRVRAFGTPTDTHELQQLPNGHFLVIAYRPRSGVNLTAYGGPEKANVYDGEIQELTKAGKRVWSWNSKNHIDPAETGRWWEPITHDQNRKKSAADRYWDLVHLNSVEKDGDGFIVSARHLDAVFRIDRKSKRITWKLGGTHTDQSLALSGDPFPDQPFGGQHDARLYGDGTLTLFDNATLLSRGPRALRYRIDPIAKTATFLEGVSAGVKESVFGGSARKLPDTNWVVYWGGSTLVTEQTPAGQRVLSLSFHNKRWGYRVAPILPGQLSAITLRHGMDRMSKRKANR
jgi:Arylsulfotransferase (ASST)